MDGSPAQRGMLDGLAWKVPFSLSVCGSECVCFDCDREEKGGHQWRSGTQHVVFCFGEPLSSGALKYSPAFAGVFQIQCLLWILLYSLPTRVNSCGCF